MAWRIPFFRIFYSTTYTSLFFILLVLLGITPATIIYDSFASSAYQYLFMIGAAYILTALLTLLLYSSRLYSNRATLAGVGKSYIPVEEGEVSRNVRKEIVKGLQKSALAAAEIRPRAGISKPGGSIERPGWAAPDSTTGHVYYETVVRELPNLLEARLVELGHEPRTAGSGLRDYLQKGDLQEGDGFLELYERARFNPPLTAVGFRSLMEEFARLLQGLRPPSVGSVDVQ